MPHNVGTARCGRDRLTGTLGGAVLWLPNPNLTVKASLVNTIDSSTSSGFDDFGDGMTASIEAAFQYRLGDLPGGMNIGGLYSFDQDFTQVNGQLIFIPGQGLSAASEDDTWAIYWSMWQYLWVENAGDKPINVSDGSPDYQGVGVFARLGAPPRTALRSASVFMIGRPTGTSSGGW